MKKSELNATLGSIKASDELVRRTVLAAEERKHNKEERRSFFDLRFGMRLAGAACALMLTVGVMSALIGNGTLRNEGAPDVQKAKEAQIVCTDTVSTEAEDGSTDPIEALRAAADECTGGWAIIEGRIDYASAGDTSDDGRLSLEVKISAERIAQTSATSVSLPEQIGCAAVFNDEASRQRMIDSIGSELCLLIEMNADGEWQIAKVIYR